MKCSVCKRDMTYFTRDQRELEDSYWWREYPDFVFCRVCWGELDDLREHLVRLTIARRLKQFRSEGKCKHHAQGRRKARRFWNSLRGCGVPPNMRRLHKRRIR